MKRDGRDETRSRAPSHASHASVSRVTGEPVRRLGPVAVVPPSAADDEGACARDFADFVDGDRGWTAARPPHPDPDFREGLRRRLWRMQVMAQGGRGRVRH